MQVGRFGEWGQSIDLGKGATAPPPVPMYSSYVPAPINNSLAPKPTPKPNRNPTLTLTLTIY